MNKRKKMWLNAATAVTTAAVIIACSYLAWRAYDYLSADRIYENICSGAVRHGEAVRHSGVVQHGGALRDERSDEADAAAGKNENESGSSSGQDNGKSLPCDDSLPTDMPVIDWEELKKAGKDIVAWLEMPSLGIGYPVVQGEDNEYYLHRLPNGEYKKAGSLFMEAGSAPDLSDVNTIIYGHNMNNGSMFGKFRTMTQKDYESSPYIWLCTKDKTCLYSICSIHISQVDDTSYTLFGRGTEGDRRISAWISAENARSYLDTPIPQGAEERMLTLSTCASVSDERRVVQGILVAEFRNVG